ncbi:MAG: Gfo/Idh/MocA family oxidoreductase [Clostridia bacterium]|nr:Gfo/Idh/MocA family oxidoreductase [Clostridia bacterium]
MSSSKKKIILIGAGMRGRAYTDIAKDVLSDTFEVVAVADPNDASREHVKSKHSLPDNMCFTTWEPLLDMPRIADIAIISTLDRDHIKPSLLAIEKGYNLLLEKPAGATPEECRAIQRAAEKNGVFALVCHVLRYTDFFIALKKIISSGEIGEVRTIQHIEGVGNVHQSHSFVRGNWRNSDESTPMILQKSCHDMDILAWLVGKKCKKVQSFGSLSYFIPRNAPEGAPERCIDGCPKTDCPYNAVKLYYDDKDNSWFRNVSTGLLSPTDEDVERALRTTDYGKCVFKCPNNVVDHQVVNLLFEDDVTVSFSMNAFNKGGRTIKIMGTKGELNATFGDPIIKLYDFLTEKEREINIESGKVDDTIVGGHGGGDTGIMLALRDLILGIPNSSICDIGESCDNHMIAFAAEESRILGTVVDMDEYMSRFD